jgi:tetratricopeptide (TPR) repeat protein
VSYARQAGARAAARSANRAAVEWFDLALAALARLPQDRSALEQAVDLRLDLRRTLTPLGEGERALELLREADAIALTLGDGRRRGRVRNQVSFCLRLLGDHDGALEAARDALALAESIDDLSLRVVARHRLGQVLRQRGDYRRAIDLFRSVAAAIPDELVGECFDMAGLPSVECRLALADCLAELGALDEAHPAAREALRLAEQLDYPFEQSAIWLIIGRICLQRGDLAQAIAALERAHGLSRPHEFSVRHLDVLFQLGFAHVLAGRPGVGLPLVDEAVRLTASLKAPTYFSWNAARCAEAYLLAGRREDALVQAASAWNGATARRERGHQAWALRLLGEVAAQAAPPELEQAEAHFLQALALAKDLGMRPLQAHCHLGLGKVYRRIGRLEEARAELSTAIGMLREMGMAHWLPEAEAELAAASV